MKLPKLDILEIIEQDVQEIFSSRKKSKVLHKTKDIDASGNEVENAVRRVIRRKLPLKYYVSQGHIVDEQLQTSSQLDLIIADNIGSPVLFTSENGTEYIPYESIYSFAEIKSTYYANKDYLGSFVKSTKNIYDILNRKDTPHNQLTQEAGLDFGAGISFQARDKRPFKNPLFKFMFFVDSNDFSINDIKKILNETDDKYLPNLIVLLDRGIVAKAIIDKSANSSKIELFPEFINDSNKNEYKWLLVEFKDDKNKQAINLSFLNFSLNFHLKNCLLMRPDLMKYFGQMFEYNGQIIE
ncbi:hypothetical protein H4O20_13290 [Aequorivita sp. 609]|uniref:DUF6602 domain-containing protein n=1 Tax=Aequorivita TaxID=153265 RepID=UPI00161B7CFD|nr:MULTISPECIES: DUF6602 domain-containing protein [Aequorivita]MBB6682419.1 hypothetical protein [Aequorivita sp. 609]